LQTQLIKNSVCTNFWFKYLVNPAKSSTFAADFATNASEREAIAKSSEKCNAENQPLTKKMQSFLKKVA
jgi:hypothetical protein